MSIATFSLVFYLLLVKVYSQTFPRVSFMSQSLANHSYVDITTVGIDASGSDSVQCITDLTTCCTGSQSFHRGDWYFPNGVGLQFDGGIYEIRGAQRVDLRRLNNANSPTGIYRCEIPTNAVNDDTDNSVRDTVYVGLYTSSGGDVTISGDVMYDSDQMTLTCISTGGPATTVTWTRDSTTINGGNKTVLTSATTATYTHTLTVTDEVPGSIYTCTVSNNKPSTASKSFTIPGGTVTDPSQPTSDGTSTTDGEGGDGDGGGGGGGGGEDRCEAESELLGVGSGAIALISILTVWAITATVLLVVMGVVIFVLLRNRHRSEETVNTGLELLKVSGEKELQITSNEAYNVVALSGGPTESEYETVQPSSSSSTTHHPPPPPATSSDQFQTTSNEAYNIVRETGGTVTIPPPT